MKSLATRLWAHTWHALMIYKAFLNYNRSEKLTGNETWGGGLFITTREIINNEGIQASKDQTVKADVVAVCQRLGQVKATENDVCLRMANGLTAAALAVLMFLIIAKTFLELQG